VATVRAAAATATTFGTVTTAGTGTGTGTTTTTATATATATTTAAGTALAGVEVAHRPGQHSMQRLELPLLALHTIGRVGQSTVAHRARLQGWGDRCPWQRGGGCNRI
jgi:hypothetical protein